MGATTLSTGSCTVWMEPKSFSTLRQLSEHSGENKEWNMASYSGSFSLYILHFSVFVDCAAIRLKSDSSEFSNQHLSDGISSDFLLNPWKMLQMDLVRCQISTGVKWTDVMTLTPDVIWCSLSPQWAHVAHWSPECRHCQPLLHLCHQQSWDGESVSWAVIRLITGTSG